MDSAAPGTEPHRASRTLTSGQQLDLLISIYQHRLISTGQLHRLHGTGRTLRSTQLHLAALRRADLAAAHQHKPWTPAVWYATGEGAEIAELAKIRRRPYRMRATVAAGQIASHTLAVNEVGCLLVEAARKRRDEFGPLDWEHEIAHPYRSTGFKPSGTDHLVIADAVLYYAATNPDRTQVSLVRFLELDRGTLSVEALVRKIRRYGQMHDHLVGDRPVWRRQYARFPRLLDGLPAERLARRRGTFIDLAREEPEILDHAEPLSTMVTTLLELGQLGPFAEIFHPLIPHPNYGEGPLTLLRRPSNDLVIDSDAPR